MISSGSAKRPIGILDSGAGGLSVWREIRRALPGEDLLYAADTAHLPYGDKPAAYVRQRVHALAGVLVAQGAKALVVACNTATAAAVESLRERFALPVVGMEPGIKPAILGSRNGVVGILATASMVRSQRMAQLVQRYGSGKQVIIQPCPGLVELVERHALHGAETTRLLQQYLQPMLDGGVDTLVLGCTHYPFLMTAIRHLVGPGLQIIDTAPAIARRLHSLLEAQQLLNPSTESGQARFFSSGDAAQQAALFSQLLGQTVEVEALPEEASSAPLR
ncbi:MAG: glutamate racemase [Thiohalomonadaceae bacterium]